MAPTSAQHVRVFGCSPPTVVQDRPEIDLDFLRWLAPREEMLRQCIERDMTRRHLSDIDVAVQTLRNG